MAKCKWCDRSGMFLKVSSKGLCSTCDVVVPMDIQWRVRIIQESEQLVISGKTLQTRLGRCEDIINQARELLAYEQKGLDVMKPRPSEVIRTFQEKRKVVIMEGIRQEIEEAQHKASLTTATTRSKINQYTKALSNIRQLKAQNPDLPSTAKLESAVVKALSDIQLTAYLQEAEKAEIKGNRKKALDQYYEALYFLQHDEIDDSLQRTQLAHIEAKIKELSSGKPEPETPTATLLSKPNR